VLIEGIVRMEELPFFGSTALAMHSVEKAWFAKDWLTDEKLIF
jgi:hypothetical protein